MWALIEGSRIAELAVDKFEVSSSLKWVDCDDSITEQHTYEGGAFIEPSTPSPDELESHRISLIKLIAKEKIISVMSEEKQRNSLAELIALQATPLSDWTPEMKELFEVHKYNWKTIDEIRATSNDAEATGLEVEMVVWPI